MTWKITYKQNNLISSSHFWSQIGLLSLGLTFAACGGETGGGDDPGGSTGGASDGSGGADDGAGMGGDDGDGGTGAMGNGMGGDDSGSGSGGKDSSGGGSSTGGDTGTGGHTGGSDICKADEQVVDAECVPCPDGSTAPAGADTEDGDTECTPTLCEEDEHVQNHECVACPETWENGAGDDATGEDTVCEDVVCNDLIDLVPAMVGADDAFGTVTTSGTYSGSYPGWHAFDGTGSLWLSEENEAPAWLSYEFKGGAEEVREYSIMYNNGHLTSRAPNTWTFEGWDGEAWVQLDAQSGQTGWVGGEERSFEIASPGFYSSYRLHVTEDNDHRAPIIVVSVAKLRLKGSACACDAATVPQVPFMSSGDDEFGTVTTSGDYSVSYPGWQAFDETHSLWLSEQGESPAWIGYEFKGSARHITQYAITYSNGELTSRAPRDFTLQGYDGAEWVILDTRTSETGWNSGETRTFDVASPGDYSKYRLHITEDNDHREPIVVASVGKFQLLGHSCVE